MARGTKLVFIFIVASALADLIPFQPCPDLSDQCTVSDVGVSLCSMNKTCVLKKGVSYNVTFNFVPKFSSTSLSNKAYWQSNYGDIPWGGLGHVGCDYTTCPIEPNKQHTFEYALHIGKKFPSGTFNVKWLLADEANENLTCCFLGKIDIKK